MTGIKNNISVGNIMKGAGITLICAITIARGYVVETNNNGCPLDPTIERLLEHENCKKFYQCFQGNLIEHTCPSDLLFNIEENKCDWPENVVCGNRIVPESEENNTDNGSSGEDNASSGNCDPSQAPAICAAEGSDGVLVAHENCNQFYKCSEGVPVQLQCPTNLLYNPITEQCDWPGNVQCGNRVIPDTDSGNGDNSGGNEGGSIDNNNTCNCNPGEAPSLCATANSDGLLVAHENCNQFYKCSNGRPIVQNCPTDLLYNPYTEQCDWPENVNCGDRVITDCNENGGGSGDGGAGGDNGSDGNGACNCNPGEAPSLCAASNSDGILVAHENCNQFYKCFNGRPIVQNCPTNLLYNPYTEQCDWPENVNCGDRVITDCDENGGGSSDGGAGGDNGGAGNGTCNCNPGEAPSLCAAAGSDGILVAHENCNQFYKCFNGVPVVQNCPVNLLYNPYKEQCDWPENVNCGDRVIPDENDTGSGGGSGGGGSGDGGSGGGGSGGDNGGGGSGTCNCNPGEAPSICGAAGSNGVLIAHENCNQFYKCFNGLPVSMYCPGNLLYNAYTEQCDWPENVNCGDRVIPDCDEDGGSSGGGGSGGGGSGGGGSGDGGSGGGGAGGDNGGAGNGTCNCNPGEAPSLCAAAGSDGILVAHENCNQFYKCFNGVPVVQNCPVNLLYNPYKEQCDWPENVNCGDRVIPDENDNGSGGGSGGGGSGGGESGGGGSGDGGSGGGGSGGDNGGGGSGTCNCNPGEAPSICGAAGSDGVLIAHENCNQFYKCFNGLPVSLYCPGNLLYNAYTEQCDWPENVNCGDRVIPDCDEDGGSSGGGGSGGGGSGGGGSGDGGSGGGGAGGDNGGAGNGTCNCNPGEAPSLCAAAGSDGILVAHENCNQFYKCFNGVPVVQNCPVNLLYNPYKELCDWPENVNCGDRVIPDENDNGSGGGSGDGGSGGGGSGDGGSGGGGSGGDNGGGGNGTCNCNPGEAPSICGAAGSNGVLIAHENCNQFYKCFNGLPVSLYCPGNLLYNAYTEQCDWPENVNCGDRVIPDCDEDGGSSGGGGSGGGGSGGGGSGDGGSGGGGAGGDNGGAGNGTCNCNPGEAPSLCAAAGSDGILVAHENCNQFYKCFNGVPVVQNCPVNLLYNPYKELCDWPENVNCGDRVIPDENDNGSGGGSGDGGSGGGGSGDGGSGGGGSGGDNGGGGNGTCNCNPGEAPSICGAAGSNGVLIAHENCNQFYKCFNGLPVSLYCPGNLLYNAYTEQCDWPENVNCGDRVIPDCDEDGGSSGGGGSGGGGSGGGGSGDGGSGGGGAGGDNGGAGNGTCNCNPGEAPSLCAAAGSDGILVAHENCNQFYKCFNGVPVVQNCPVNLLYNPYKEQCDWPENVNCGDRVIPDENDNGSGGGSGGGGSGGGESGGGGSGDGGSGGGESGGDNGGGGSGTCNCNPGEAPSICGAAGSNGVLIAHENCNQFYKCFNGLPVSLYCPGNLLYNAYTEQCDWPENVNCGDRVIPDCDEDGGSSGGGGSGGGGSGGGGSGDGGSGGGGAGGDNGGAENGTCNCNPGEAPSLCAAAGSDGILVAHENCNQFYKCFNGVPVVQNCPVNLLYNPYKELCDWPENVNCGDRVIPDENDNGSGGGSGGGGSGGGGSGGGGSGDGGSGGGGSGGDNGGGGNGTCNCNPGEAPSICGAAGSNGVLIAHENCNQFYKCFNGLPVSLYCPGNLLYNAYTEQCDWPENVNCGDRVIPDCDEDGGSSGGGGSGGGGSGGGGSGDGGSGGGGAGGDNGGAGNGTCNCNPGEAPSLCAAAGSDGILVAHENCNQFYKCFNGVPVVQNCPVNLLYNPYKELCDWPENVNCGDRVIPDENDNGSGGGSGGGGSGGGGSGDGGSGGGGSGGDNGGGGNGTCNCNPGEAPSICGAAGSNGVLIAHENCNQFYKCFNGLPVSLYCPGNLLYNAYTEQCDWPENVNCGDRVIPDCDEDGGSSGGGGSGGGSSGGGGSGDGGSGGGGAGGDNGGAGNGTCNCNPGEAPSLCAAAGSDGILVAHENCNQFYKCFNGVPVVQNCPVNLLYNPYKEQCDWPENVNCGDRVIPDENENGSGGGSGGGGSGGGESGGGGSGDGGSGGGGSGGDNGGGGSGTCNCNPGEAPSICGAAGSNGVLIAHENCNQFYKCFNGLPVSLYCPGNLLYNAYTEQCDWPENVNCGDRVIPDCDEDGGSSGGGGSGGGGSGGGGSGDGGSGGGGAGGDNGGAGNGTCNCNPGEAPSLCAAAGSDGILVAHENCNQFYKCFNGVPVVQNCPVNLLYNPYKELCDWPENVNCGDRVIPDENDNGSGGGSGGGGSGGGGSGDGGSGGGGSGGDNGGGGNGTCNCNPGEAPSICGAAGSNGVLIAHENCNQFYKCFNGLPVSLYCPGNLLYNAYTEQCDWPENVNCGDRVIPDCDEDGGSSGGGGSGGGGSGGGGSGDGGSGGGGAGGDNGGAGNGTCNCNPGEAPSLCAAAGSDGILVAHENCNQFYKCFNGVPVVQNCPVNLLYNPYKEQCDWPENVNCGDRVIPDENDNGSGGGSGGGGSGGGESGGGGSGDGGSGGGGSGGDNGGGGSGTCNCNPGEAPSICGAAGSDGVLIAHENCNQFYKCFNGLPVSLYCPGNLLYNAYTEQCDWPENVNCGDRVIPDCDEDGGSSGGGGSGGGGSGGGGSGDGGSGGGGAGGDNGGAGNGTCNCNPGEAPSLCAAAGSDGILVAHENCNQFYKCFNGVPVVQNCPVNLLYNPYKEQCDWPENVNCGDRVIPDENDNGSGGGSGGGGSGGGGSGGGGSGDGGSGGGGSGGDNGGGGSGTCNCNPGEAPSICGAAGSNGVLIAHENCNQFYKCFNGLPVSLYCPGNLLYNAYTEQCDWPENVNCGDRVIPDCDEDGGSSGGGGSGGGGSGGGGSGDGGSGGGGAGGDNGGAGNGTCNCNPGEAPSLCAAAGSDGILVAHENCNQFYKCFNGVPVVQNCPVNLLYNPYKEQCDWPENVNCGDRVIPDENDNGSGGGSGGGGSGGGESGGGGSGDGGSGGGGSGGDNGGGGSGTCNCNPGEAPSICGAAGSNGVLIAHENCNQFYKCFNGLPVSLYCPGNLLYNAYTEQCDWPENVNCGDRVIPDCDEDGGSSGGGGSGGGGSGGGGSGDGGSGGGGAGGDNGGAGNGTCNCNPGEAPSLCAAAGSDGILVAHENCNQFYKCFNGVPVVQNCPVNLLYNPYKELCDWPENVNCGDRVIPDENDNGSGGGSGGGGSGGGGSGGGGSGDGGSGGGGSGGDNGGGGNGTCNCNPGEAPSICGAAGSNGVLIAHENCNQFYKCFNGLPVSLYCPGNLLYNAYTEQCDWPENVNCGDRVIPDCDEDGGSSGGGGSGGGGSGGGGSGDGGSGGGGAGGDNGGAGNGTCNCNPGEAPSLCAAAGSDGILVAHENCNQFYKCFNGVPVVQNCPVNLLYNPYKEQCDWPENVNCGDRVIPDENDNGSGGGSGGGGSGDGGSGGGGSGGDNGGGGSGTCNCNPGEAPSICGAAGSNGVLIAHENCNQFYKCFNGLPVSLYCPGNLLYNAYTEQCDWPENVNCGDRVIPDCDEDGGSSGGGGSGGGGSGGGGSGDGGFGGGGAGGDNGGAGNGTCNCNPAEAPSLCAAAGSDGILVAHENCNQFYKCFNGVPVVQNCPVNLLYNPYMEQCDWPENVNCGDRLVPGDGSESGVGGDNGGNVNGTCNCNPGEAPSLCASMGSEGVLVAHEYCNQFYKCSNGRPLVQKCPVNLLYDPYKEECDWPENVNCHDRVVQENDGNENDDIPNEVITICASDSSDSVFIKHQNCNQFYVCVQNKPVILTCPPSLFYEPNTNRCDWSHNVDCGNRFVPRM